MDDLFQTDLAWLAVEEPQPARSRKASPPVADADQPDWLTARRSLSDELRARLSESAKNRKPLTPEQQAHKSALIRQSWIDKPNRVKADVVKRLADTLRGRPSPRRGATQSDQARAKIAQAVQERHHSTDPKWVAWRAEQAQRRADRMAQRVTVAKQKEQIRQNCVDNRIQTHFGSFRSWAHCVSWLQEQGVVNPRVKLAQHRRAYPELYSVVLKRDLYKQIKAYR